MISDISHYKQPISISPSVKETAGDDGAVLLDVEQGECFCLNSIGLRIWTLLKEGNNIERIADVFESDYSVPRAELLEDLCLFIRDLESNKLLFVGCGLTDSGKEVGFWNWLWNRRNSA